MVKSLSPKEIVEYPNGGKSYFYVVDQTAIIVDEGICKCNSEEDAFPYTLITEKQNSYMHRYGKVYRFLREDEDAIENFLENADDNTDINFSIRTVNREDDSNASPLEFLFEEKFTNVYGMEGLKYLRKEYGVVDKDGHNFFLDYYAQKDDGGIPVYTMLQNSPYEKLV